MKDGQDRSRPNPVFATGSPVDSLASRAVAVIAGRQEAAPAPLSERFIGALYDAVTDGGNARVDEIIAAMLDAGCPAGEVLEFYIPEVARRLGNDWCDDRLGFAQVSIGSARLQHAVRALSDRCRRVNLSGAGHAVLVVVPRGEHHTLGAVILTEQLRQAGVSVRMSICETSTQVLRTVASGQYDAIFFSISSTERLEDLRHLVEKSKKAAPVDVPVVVGGAFEVGAEDVKELAGADHAADDYKEALRLCGLTIFPSDAARRGKKE